MIKKVTNIVGFIYTFLVAIGSLILLFLFKNTDFAKMTLFHTGVDIMGAFVCVVLFYGCIGQVERSTRSFSILVVITSLSFIVNELMWFISGKSEFRILYLICCIISKLINLSMIYCFFLYVKETLNFEGKLATLSTKILPILLIVSYIVVLINSVYPLTFSVNENGEYLRAKGYLKILEDIYLIVGSIITTILIIKCHCPRRQKWAAMSFILIPIAEFVGTGVQFAFSTQYGAVLLSLILMYCILFNDRSKKLASTKTELSMATQIQKAMLPSVFPPFPERKEFDIYASMDAAKEVGGDFYDFFLIDDDHLCLVIADVSGKGIPAALYMMISKTILKNYAKLGFGAGEILTKTNETLCSGNKTDMFVTTWVGILEISSGKMTCANAGHEYPAICKDGEFSLYKDKHGFVLGGMDGIKYREYEILLNKGDKIFLYTDGVAEATKKDKSMFGLERMLDALNENASLPPKEILNTVHIAVDNFVNNSEQFDDITMLCMEYKGKE